MTIQNDKRARLVEAADQLFHEKGFNQTTLANIADYANVPLGNVYYYFRSKELILQAVIEGRRQQFSALIAELRPIAPKERIKAFIAKILQPKDILLQYGDAVGGLSQELGRAAPNKEANGTAPLMEATLDWLSTQFKEMGAKGKPEYLSASLLSQIHGLCVLAVTLKDKNLLERQSLLLNEWVESA